MENATPGSDARGSVSQRIADDLRAAITSGQLAPGALLPSEREITEAYQTTKSTAGKALATLRSEGLIRSQPGRGVFVREPRPFIRLPASRYARRGDGIAPVRREASSGGWVDRCQAFPPTEVAASSEVALRLGITPGDPVSEIRYLWFADEEPLQVSTQWEPLGITRNTPIEIPVDGTLGNPDVISRFDSIGVRVDHVTELVTSRLPTPDEARLLELPEGIPVIRIARTHLAADLPVETADITIRADRFAIENTQDVQ